MTALVVGMWAGKEVFKEEGSGADLGYAPSPIESEGKGGRIYLQFVAQSLEIRAQLLPPCCPLTHLNHATVGISSLAS
jgi:hypothetical protein